MTAAKVSHRSHDIGAFYHQHSDDRKGINIFEKSSRAEGKPIYEKL
jgi:hypothetical protein